MADDSKGTDAKGGLSRQALEGMGFGTRAVRAGTERSQFGEHSEAMYLT